MKIGKRVALLACEECDLYWGARSWVVQYKNRKCPRCGAAITIVTVRMLSQGA